MRIIDLREWGATSAMEKEHMTFSSDQFSHLLAAQVLPVALLELAAETLVLPRLLPDGLLGQPFCIV